MSQTHTPSTMQQRGGFALIVVLIMTMLTLVVIVTVVSVGTNRSFTTTHASKQSDQALMAAQSGIDSFLPTVKAAGYGGTLYGIECWVEGASSTELSTVSSCPATSVRNLPTQRLTDDANGPRAVLDVVGGLDETNSVFTVRSVGFVGPVETAAKAVLTQKVRLVKPTMLNVAPPAALTSCPSIKGGGSATINGGAQAQTGVVPVYTNFNNGARVKTTGATIVSGMTWPQTVTLSDSTLTLGRGNYVSIGGAAYRVVQRKSDTELAVVPADAANPPTSGSLSGDLSLIPFALRDKVTATGQTAKVLRSTEGENVNKATYRMPFSDPSGVYVGDVLYVPIPDAAGTVTTYAVTVTGKGYVDNDVEQGYVEVALSVTNEATNLYNVYKGYTTVAVAGKFKPPTEAQLLSVKPGAAFSRYVAGGTSATDINGQLGTGNNTIVNWGGATTVGPAAMAGNMALDCSAEEALFKQVFNGLSPNQYYDYVAPGDRLAAYSYPPILRSRLYWYGPKAYPSGNNYSFSSGDLCGTGVIVVNGNLDMQGTCAQGFTGVLYVMGDLKNAGNGKVYGAVVVQGQSNLSEASFTGSLNIKFDQSAIVRAAKDLSRPVFSLQAGSWRQQ